MAYATVKELEERWRDLSETEKGKAAVLLEDAAAILDSELGRCGLEPEGLSGELRYVSCQMVRRAMASPIEGDVTNLSRTAGSFSESLTLANPSGDMYLTSNERRLLGVMRNRGRVGMADLL